MRVDARTERASEELKPTVFHLATLPYSFVAANMATGNSGAGVKFRRVNVGLVDRGRGYVGRIPSILFVEA